MAKIFTNNNKLMTIGNSFLCKYEPPLYNITYSQVTGGTLSGPATAHANDNVNVIATPATDYTLGYITVNGSQITGTSFSMPGQNSVVSGVFNEVPPGPIPIPSGAFRVRTSDGKKPTRGSDPYSGATYSEALLVAGTTDVYDVFPQSGNYEDMLYSSTNVVEVLGANVTGVTDLSSTFRSCSNLISVALFDTSSVTNMEYMFEECYSLTTVPLFDTSNVTSMTKMFHYCYSLTSIPLFNTSKVTDMDYMFRDCYKVEGGALALYQQASSQTTPPTDHHVTFTNCGRDTTTGAAELAQIPSSWK